MDKFSDDNKKLLAKRGQQPRDELDAVLEKLEAEMASFLKDKAKWYLERDKHQKDLRPLQRELESQYKQAERSFVPLFKELAENFLGLELDIRMDKTGAHDLGLVLTIKGQARRGHHQLSESQRYFVDIALRMALVQVLAVKENPACLYVDTPEGSLDIAYETKAGRMFASFVEKGPSIIMTANINSSRLLLSLAEQCGKQHMKVHRMTSWAQFTNVQREEEALFEAAYADIENALGRRRREKLT